MDKGGRRWLGFEQKGPVRLPARIDRIYSSMAVSACPDQRHGRLPVYFPINGKLQASPAGTVNAQAKRVDCKLTLSVLRCETSDKAA